VRNLGLLAVLLLLTAALFGCAARSLGPAIAERDLTNEEDATPTPAPPTGEEDSGEDELAKLLQKEMKQPFNNGSEVKKPKTTEPADEEKTDGIRERDLPIESAPEPAPARQIEPMQRQGPLDKPLASEQESALAGAGGSSRTKAALSLAREGRQMIEKKDYYLAEKRFERALSIDSGCGQAYLGLAELRFAGGQWDQAADLATKAALRLGKQSYFLTRAHLLAAKSFANGGRLQSAYAQVQKALAVDENNSEAKALKYELEARLGVSQ
jgi:tetratricopeptide (TPR) repeat protein